MTLEDLTQTLMRRLPHTRFLAMKTAEVGEDGLVQVHYRFVAHIGRIGQLDLTAGSAAGLLDAVVGRLVR